MIIARQPPLALSAAQRYSAPEQHAGAAGGGWRTALSGATMNEDGLAVFVGLGLVALVAGRLITQVPW
jgi:hypothetical protein